MSRLPQLTFEDRRQRHLKLVELYKRGSSSRAVAKEVGLSDSHVRTIVRLYGCARRPGRPS